MKLSQWQKIHKGDQDPLAQRYLWDWLIDHGSPWGLEDWHQIRALLDWYM